MLLTDAGPTPYDLRFTLLGVPVRVSPAFWIVAALLGADQRPLGAAIWVGAVFVSVMAHEFGHALLQRLFGGRPEVVLYAMGGLARAPGVRESPLRNVAVSLAGPAAGFALWGLIRGLVAAGWFLDDPRARYFAGSMMEINWFWSLLNLAPVWPLDGGRVAREALVGLVGWSRGVRWSLVVSLVVAVALAVWQYSTTGSLWNAALFVALAQQSYAALRSVR